ncbi:MAG: hypothetical protein ABIP54_00835 [Candidatus Andersenbacteria bacterium]
MSKIEHRMYFGHELTVEFVPKEDLFPFFGKAIGGVGQKKCIAFVREDLSPRIREFVIAHEFYHLIDQHLWWGDRGREIRANVVPGFFDPLGLFLCTCATVFSWNRFKLYLHRVWHGY